MASVPRDKDGGVGPDKQHYVRVKDEGVDVPVGVRTFIVLYMSHDRQYINNSRNDDPPTLIREPEEESQKEVVFKRSSFPF